MSNLKTLLSVLGLTALSIGSSGMMSVSHAQEDPRAYPLLAKERITLGARAEYMWYGTRDNTPRTLVYKREFGAGLVASYALVPNCSLTWRSIYAVDNRLFFHAVGVNLLLYRGRP